MSVQDRCAVFGKSAERVLYASLIAVLCQAISLVSSVFNAEYNRVFDIFAHEEIQTDLMPVCTAMHSLISDTASKTCDSQVPADI